VANGPTPAAGGYPAGNEQPFVGTLQVIVGGLCNIPSDASAVVLNATVLPASPLGYVTLWPFWIGHALRGDSDRQ